MDTEALLRRGLHYTDKEEQEESERSGVACTRMRRAARPVSWPALDSLTATRSEDKASRSSWIPSHVRALDSRPGRRRPGRQPGRAGQQRNRLATLPGSQENLIVDVPSRWKAGGSRGTMYRWRAGDGEPAQAFLCMGLALVPPLLTHFCSA